MTAVRRRFDGGLTASLLLDAFCAALWCHQVLAPMQAWKESGQAEIAQLQALEDQGKPKGSELEYGTPRLHYRLLTLCPAAN